MLVIGICALAFVTCYLAGRKSLGIGLVALLFFGYFYGILRANLLTSLAHFIFDAGMIGLFLSPSWRSVMAADRRRSATVLIWTALLVGWPMLLFLLPFQPFLVSLVGLRGNIFFVPLLLLGARLKTRDVFQLAAGLAVLNLIAVGFAGAEYFMGVPRFFPLSPVTLTIYSSNDVEGGFFRIPATFANAHAFGGTMVATLPYLIGLWTRAQSRLFRWLALIAIPVSLLGILMSATRTNFLFGCMMLTSVLVTVKLSSKQRLLFTFVILLLAGVAINNLRFARFKSLKDTDYITDRIAGSVNRSFWEIVAEYPMGNGLGGGGTSIPYFLEGQVRNPIGMENEYARILSEQGVIGLLLWLSFVGWFLTRGKIAFQKGPWATTRRLSWCLVAIDVGTAWIGVGMLTSIPFTLLTMIGIGWTSVPESETAPVPGLPSAVPQRVRRSYVLAN